MAEAKQGFQTPKEITDYFRQKQLAPAFHWGDVWGEEHAYAHTVAKVVELEVLQVFHSTLDEAISGGWNFERWVERIQPELARRGWWGKRTVADPTGKHADEAVDFSKPRRLKTVFWSNMRAARAAGQWERLQRTKQAVPYLLYVRTAASDPRPEHLTWAGILLPVDDPFWNTHFPPNGWGCLCSVRGVTKWEATRLLDAGEMEIDGQKVPISTEAPKFKKVSYVNKRTGVVTEIPEGIDPGWHTNPGLSRARTLTARLQGELEKVGEEIARRQIDSLFDSQTPSILAGLAERVQLPVAVYPKLKDMLGANSSLIVTSSDTIKAKTGKHAVVSLDTFSLVQGMLDLGTIVDEGRAETERAVYVQLGGAWWKLVIKKSAAGFLRLHTIYRVDEAYARKWLEGIRGGRT
ncbi:phage minor head protein [Roseibium sediminis]|uniref:phage head morphogenesis protein n=1 Tax=Roseibium sediminis TaxID=1775174 RepID=UPI00123C8ED0|nr:phage minor head protein [Roseibium sediminis]